MAESSILEQSKASLSRIQNFSPKSLIQLERLGALAFTGAVDPATRLVNHFKLLPIDAIDQFADTELSSLRSLCDSVYSVFSEIMSFDTEAGDNKTRQQNSIDRLGTIFQSVFSQTYALIAYSAARTVDFNKLDEQGRAAVQRIEDQSNEIVNDLSEKQKTIDRILQDARDVAAEQGVTLQAKFFESEAKAHLDSSKNWLIASIAMVATVISYSVFTLFFSKIPFLAATDSASAIQITTSKLLVFFVLIYALFQCVKNYSSHMHNSVVNKHRQNSLLTYRTLSEASASIEGREIVLQHAAAAIYAPIDTGYVRNEERGYSEGGLIGMAGRTLTSASGGSHP